MIEDTAQQDSDDRSRAAAELDKDPFGRHGASLRPSLLRWAAGVVLIGVGLQTAVVLLDSTDQPPRSFLARRVSKISIRMSSRMHQRR